MGFDTHFHEGRMRTQERRTTFQSDFDLGGGITNECNPTNFVNVDHQSGMSRRLATILRQASRLNVYVALGIHPKQAEARISEDDWYMFRSLLRSRNFVAVGEFGLDSSRGSLAPRDKQIEVASRCIDLATELDLPMIIHQRDSEDEYAPTLQNQKGGSRQGTTPPLLHGHLAASRRVDDILPKRQVWGDQSGYVPVSNTGPRTSLDPSNGEDTSGN